MRSPLGNALLNVAPFLLGFSNSDILKGNPLNIACMTVGMAAIFFLHAVNLGSIKIK